MTVDKLYDHTGDPADIDLAITWLRRAAGHPGLSPADRRRALISLASQHASQGAALRAAQRRSSPGSESRAAFGAAIKQFEDVLAELAGRDRRSDRTRAHDRVDAWLGLLETYYQRGGGQAADEDLDVIAQLRPQAGGRADGRLPAASVCAGTQRGTAHRPDHAPRRRSVGRRVEQGAATRPAQRHQRSRHQDARLRRRSPIWPPVRCPRLSGWRTMPGTGSHCSRPPCARPGG